MHGKKGIAWVSKYLFWNEKNLSEGIWNKWKKILLRSSLKGLRCYPLLKLQLDQSNKGQQNLKLNNVRNFPNTTNEIIN